MPDNKKSDSPIGIIIKSRLEEMERSQPWLARQVHKCTNTINGIIRGRFNPSEELLEKLSTVLSVDFSVLSEAVKRGDESSG